MLYGVLCHDRQSSQHGCAKGHSDQGKRELYGDFTPWHLSCCLEGLEACRTVVIVYQGMCLVDQCIMPKDATNTIIGRSRQSLHSMLGCFGSQIVRHSRDSGKLAGSISCVE